jgi:DNA polymerase I-like protein with 3'-5' exonuclease and polymerase domains
MMLQNSGSILHPDYNMLIATGRIHMHEPNVQSVPRDFELSDGSTLSMRSMFCARLGNVLVSADYRQVELRIMAHLSGDERLIHLLNSGTDVFAELAARINKTDQVTDAMRQQAKQVRHVKRGVGKILVAGESICRSGRNKT